MSQATIAKQKAKSWQLVANVDLVVWKMPDDVLNATPQNLKPAKRAEQVSLISCGTILHVIRCRNQSLTVRLNPGDDAFVVNHRYLDLLNFTATPTF